ncbi:uncharacterized protein PG998_014307 [Apiospora kogelbergensis]|uniref:uncharacterized protein n=1 Tax=Apiospora kogelbergensis TaxID=1337665 RepID=UPI003130C8CD
MRQYDFSGRPGLLHRLPEPPLAGLVVPPRDRIRPRGRQPPSVPPSTPDSKTASAPVLHQNGRLGKVSKTTQGGCGLSRVHHRRCSRSRRLRERRFIASTGHRSSHKRIDPSEATMRQVQSLVVPRPNRPADALSSSLPTIQKNPKPGYGDSLQGGEEQLLPGYRPGQNRPLVYVSGGG